MDDSAYLRQVIDEIEAVYSVDARRVFFIGHPNGGFMSHRMACDHADAVAAFVSLAGAQAHGIVYLPETSGKHAGSFASVDWPPP